VSALRRLLFWTLIAGIVGTGAELLLLGHYESLTQIAPLALIGLSLPVLVWYRLQSGSAGLRIVQGVMLLFLVAGCAGVGLHYLGNHEFELEMYPSLVGAELVRKTLTGATPVLAPGSMALLGLVGLAYTLSDS
jgi:hypothetical protein